MGGKEGLNKSVGGIGKMRIKIKQTVAPLFQLAREALMFASSIGNELGKLSLEII